MFLGLPCGVLCGEAVLSTPCPTADPLCAVGFLLLPSLNPKPSLQEASLSVTLREALSGLGLTKVNRRTGEWDDAPNILGGKYVSRICLALLVAHVWLHSFPDAVGSNQCLRQEFEHSCSLCRIPRARAPAGVACPAAAQNTIF